MQKITTFLMFEGKAEEAMKFYISIFRKSEIINIDYYKPDEAGEAGTVKKATFSIYGQEFLCIASSVKHGFTFTPAISLFVNCEEEKEIDDYFNKLSENGNIFMPLSSYPFSEKFGWIQDKFGVSWQFNLIKK